MKEEFKASQRNEDSPELESGEKHSKSSTTRRAVVKGLFVAPAIIAIGHVPAFAHGGSVPANNGDDWWDDKNRDHNDWDHHDQGGDNWWNGNNWWGGRNRGGRNRD